MLPQRMRTQRAKAKMSQQQLAELLEVSQQAVAKWETGKTEPNTETLGKMSEIFGVSVDYLLGRSDIYSALGSEPPLEMRSVPVRGYGEGGWNAPPAKAAMIPVVHTLRPGYGCIEFEGEVTYAVAEVDAPGDYFYLIVKGDTMKPQIAPGDRALIRRQDDIEGEGLYTVFVDGEEGTVTKVHKEGDVILLQPFNAAYPPRILTEAQKGRFRVAGRVVKTERFW